MNNLKIFENEEFGQVRTVEVGGKIYFVGVDIAKALGYANPSKAVIQYCKGVTKLGIPSNGGVQDTNCVPEGDMYRLITHSELPSAERFESWVFDDVLPAIRQTGQYQQKPLTQLEILQQSVAVLGGKQAEAYKDAEIRAKVYRDIYDQIKREFGIYDASGRPKSYKALKRKYLADAHELIDCYTPPTYLDGLIEITNAQISLALTS